MLLATVNHHSLTFQWPYSVSQTVASFSITGLLGFIVVKKLKLETRKLSDVPRRTIGALAVMSVVVAIAASFVTTSPIGVGLVIFAAGAVVFVVTISGVIHS